MLCKDRVRSAILSYRVRSVILSFLMFIHVVFKNVLHHVIGRQPNLKLSKCSVCQCQNLSRKETVSHIKLCQSKVHLQAKGHRAKGPRGSNKWHEWYAAFRSRGSSMCGCICIYLCVLKLKQYITAGEAPIYFFAVNVILVLLCTNKHKMDFFLDLLSQASQKSISILQCIYLSTTA